MRERRDCLVPPLRENFSPFFLSLPSLSLSRDASSEWSTVYLILQATYIDTLSPPNLSPHLFLLSSPSPPSKISIPTASLLPLYSTKQRCIVRFCPYAQTIATLRRPNHSLDHPVPLALQTLQEVSEAHEVIIMGTIRCN